MTVRLWQNKESPDNKPNEDLDPTINTSQHKPQEITQTKTRQKSDSAKIYVCRFCEKFITHSRERLFVEGKFEHTFFNPHGIVFHILTFKACEGIHLTGELTFEFSWFSGTAWRIALCADCWSHLGWFYQGQESGFFGLIQSHLKETKG